MSTSRVGFIGGGNMTLAIAGGLLSSGFPASNIYVAEPFAEQRARLNDALPGASIGEDNAALAAQVDCLVLATKPQVLARVCRTLAAAVQQDTPLIISIAAGIAGDDIENWLGGKLAVVRVMPNQPALLRLGASGLYANERATAKDRQLADTIMSAVGEVVWVSSEQDIDSVTAISGSGPAYFYLLIDMLIQNAIAMGLDSVTARTLAVQTAVGAAALAADSELPMPDLIGRVRSPGGTTAAALDSLEQQDVRAIFESALNAAKTRAVELANEAGQ